MADEKRPLTLAGYTLLSSEYRQLWEVERPKVVKGVADAAAEGDRSENAEYIYGKKRLREIDKRLRYLGYLLKDIEVIDPATIRSETVCFGATVDLVGDDGKERRWMIVGEGESDSKRGTVSWLSPVAKALLGKRVGDFVEIEVPSGTVEYEIRDILFGSRRWND